MSNIINDAINKYCLHCGKRLEQNNLSISDYKRKKFCNNSCAASHNNKFTKRKEKKQCRNCGKELNNRQKKYCNNKCQQEYEYKVYIENWKSGIIDGIVGQYAISKHIKRYLMEKYNCQCSRCGWNERNQFTGNIPLEIHHNDGDYTNNDENNLDLLCPNCHSLTKTYKAANKGNGRKDRKKYNSC